MTVALWCCVPTSCSLLCPLTCLPEKLLFLNKFQSRSLREHRTLTIGFPLLPQVCPKFSPSFKHGEGRGGPECGSRALSCARLGEDCCPARPPHPVPAPVGGTPGGVQRGRWAPVPALCGPWGHLCPRWSLSVLRAAPMSGECLHLAVTHSRRRLRTASCPCC